MTIKYHTEQLMPALKELCRNFKIEIIIPLCYRKIGISKESMVKTGTTFIDPYTLDELDYYSTHIERIAAKNKKWIEDRPAVKANLNTFRRHYIHIKELSKSCVYVKYSDKECESSLEFKDICIESEFDGLVPYFKQGYDIQSVFLQRETHHYTIKLCKPKNLIGKNAQVIMPMDFSLGIKGNFKSMTDPLILKGISEARKMNMELLCVLKHDIVFPMLVSYETEQDEMKANFVAPEKKVEKIRPISDHRRNDFVCPDKPIKFVTF